MIGHSAFYGQKAKNRSAVILTFHTRLPPSSVFTMGNEERNFRSYYYEKVGCRGIEEKKSVDILLKEKPWDIEKLKQFSLRFNIPSAYRNLLWKVQLGNLFSNMTSVRSFFTFVFDENSIDTLLHRNITHIHGHTFFCRNTKANAVC